MDRLRAARNALLAQARVGSRGRTRPSGEAFNAIGQHVKRDSIFDRTIFVAQTPGAEAPEPLGAAYIPSDEGYLRIPTVMVNRIKPGCAESAIVNGILTMERDYLGTQKP